MSLAQRSFLGAQIQGPPIELTSEWLYVGHLDEIFQFVPDPSRSNGKDFALVIASPALAVQTLERLEAAGLGSQPIFAGRQEQTTVSAILNSAARMSYNESAQMRIDTVREKLVSELGLDAADIIEVPVLYEVIRDFDADYAVAYNPGIQNLVTLRDTLLVPDPEGPDESGEDAWQTDTRLPARGARPPRGLRRRIRELPREPRRGALRYRESSMRPTRSSGGRRSDGDGADVVVAGAGVADAGRLANDGAGHRRRVRGGSGPPPRAGLARRARCALRGQPLRSRLLAERRHRRRRLLLDDATCGRRAGLRARGARLRALSEAPPSRPGGGS